MSLVLKMEPKKAKKIIDDVRERVMNCDKYFSCGECGVQGERQVFLVTKKNFVDNDRILKYIKSIFEG